MQQRTLVYVDGFNLYHGALRHTPYKWLDLRSMVKSLIGADKDIVLIKYFTARVSPRANDPGQPFRQHMYFRALQSIGVQLVFGRYLSHVVKMYKAHQVPDKWLLRRADSLEIIVSHVSRLLCV